MLRKLGLLVISICIALLVSELLLRQFAPVYPVSSLRGYQYDAELGTRLKPDVHFLTTTDFQEEIRVNKLGTVNFQEDFGGYQTLVFALGDSYTQGTGLPADMSYPTQLDLTLNRDQEGFYSKQYAVVNLGVAAQGPKQELLALRRWANLIRPPNIVLFLGSNGDYQDDLLFENGYRHEHIVDGSPRWGRFTRPLQWLTNDLQLGLRIKMLLGQRRRTQVMKSHEHQNTELPPKSIAEREKPVLDQLLAYTKVHNSSLVVSWTDRGPSYEWLKSWSKENGVRFADWAPRVESVLASIPRLPKENWHSGKHYRGWVNRLIAEEYARQIRSR